MADDIPIEIVSDGPPWTAHCNAAFEYNPTTRSRRGRCACGWKTADLPDGRRDRELIALCDQHNATSSERMFAELKKLDPAGPIIPFVIARLDEDERAATAAADAGSPTWTASIGPDHQRHPDGPHLDTTADAPWVMHVNQGVWDCADPADDDCEALRRTWMAEAHHMGRYDPAAVLADIENKRAIVRAVEEIVWDLTARWNILRALAAPYTAHPDFDPAWRADA